MNLSERAAKWNHELNLNNFTPDKLSNIYRNAGVKKKKVGTKAPPVIANNAKRFSERENLKR